MAPRIQSACNPLIAAIICCGILTATAQMAPAARKGRLTAPVSVPLFFSGKKMGEATLPAGTPVLALSTQGDKTLIRTASGESWVATASVAMEALPAATQQTQEKQPQSQPTPAPTATPSAAPAPAAEAAAKPSAEAPAASAEAPSTEPVNVMMFDYKRSVINKGKFVWLALPFEKEKGEGKTKQKAVAPINVPAASHGKNAAPINLPGRCALMNCIKYFDPAFPLDPEELGQLLSKSGDLQGNDVDSLWRASKNVGLEGDLGDWNLEKIKSTLEDNSPLIALGKKACIAIAGFEKDDLLIWDPRKRTKTGKLPEGCNKMKFAEVQKYLGGDTSVMPPISISSKTTPNEWGKEHPLPEMGKPKDVKLLRLTKANSSESWEVYITHALPEIVKLCVRQDRAFVIRTGGSLVIVKPKGFKSEKQITVQTAKGEGKDMTMFELVEKVSKESVAQNKVPLEVYSVKSN